VKKIYVWYLFLTVWCEILLAAFAMFRADGFKEMK